MKRFIAISVLVSVVLISWAQTSVTTQYTTVNVDNLRKQVITDTIDSIIPQAPLPPKAPKQYKWDHILMFNYGIGGGNFHNSGGNPHDYSVVNSFGLTYAFVKKYGFYTSAVVGIRSDDSWGHWLDTEHFGYFSMTFGGVMQMPCEFPIYLYLGGGFSIADYHSSCGGGALETGVIGNYKGFTFSAGYSACIGDDDGGHQAPNSWHILKLGIGYTWSAKKRSKYIINSTSELATSSTLNTGNSSRIVFADDAFMEACLIQCDKNYDGILTEDEILSVTELNIKSCGIKDLTGIERFRNLKVLKAGGNKFLTADLSGNKQLKTITISSRKLQQVIISKDATDVSIDVYPGMVVQK